MYESPIEMIFNNVETSFEDGILKAVRKVDIAVHKEELLKALQYDRNQYQKGYADAKSKLLPKHGKWVLNHRSQLWECTNCHEEEIRTTDFCPWCGADMRGDKDE